MDSIERPAQPVDDSGEEARTRRALLHMLEDLQRERHLIIGARREWVDTVDAMAQLVMVHDAQFAVVRCNRAYAERSGLSYADIIGKPYWECFPKGIGPLAGCRSSICGAPAAARTPLGEEEFTLSTGEVFLSREFPVAGGRRFLHLFEDVTAMRRTEKEQRFTNAVLATQQETSLDGIYVVDENRSMVTCNRRFAEMWGVPDDVMRTRSDERALDTVLHKFDHPQEFLDGLKELYENRDRKLDDELHLNDGRVFHRYSSPMVGADGMYFGRVFYFRDITESRCAQAALRASEEKFRTIFDNTVDGIATFDVETRTVKFANSSMERLLGYGPRELEGLAVRQLHPAGSAQESLEAFGKAVQGKTRGALDIPMQTKSGGIVVVDVTGSVVQLEGRKLLLGTFRDASPRRAGEEKLRRVNRALRTLSAGSEALVRATGEQALVCEMTRILHEIGGYPLALVAYRTEEPKPGLQIRAFAGTDAGLMATVDLSPPDPDGNATATALALRTGRTQLLRDIVDNSAFEAWRDILVAHDAKASLGLPLRLEPGAAPFAAIGIGASTVDAFDAEEIRLLEELAGDLAYGIANLRSAEAKRQADDDVRVLARFPDENPNAVLRLDKDGTLLYANPASAHLLGACKMKVGQRAPDDRCAALATAAFESGIVQEEDLMLEDRTYAVTFSPVREAGYVNVYAVDITERRRAKEHLREALVATVGAIAATVEMRDPYTAGHQRRVADLAAAIAREMGWPEELVEGIHFGALIHDLGKVQVPSELLSKPTRLSKLELELIKTHAQAGYEIVKDIKFPWPVAAMVHQHHERLDGSGYPQGLKGDLIAPEARILAVADVVEAMSSHRPYRAGLGLEAALGEIEKNRGKSYDPQAVDACLRLFRDKGYRIEEGGRK